MGYYEVGKLRSGGILYEVGYCEVGKLRSGGSFTKWALTKWEDYEVEKNNEFGKNYKVVVHQSFVGISSEKLIPAIPKNSGGKWQKNGFRQSLPEFRFRPEFRKFSFPISYPAFNYHNYYAIVFNNC